MRISGKCCTNSDDASMREVQKKCRNPHRLKPKGRRLLLVDDHRQMKLSERDTLRKFGHGANVRGFPEGF